MPPEFKELNFRSTTMNVKDLFSSFEAASESDRLETFLSSQRTCLRDTKLGLYCHWHDRSVSELSLDNPKTVKLAHMYVLPLLIFPSSKHDLESRANVLVDADKTGLEVMDHQFTEDKRRSNKQ